MNGPHGRGPGIGNRLRSLRNVLFSTPLNSLFTIILGAALIWPAYSFADWAILRATFLGVSRSNCNVDGACWPFISANAGAFIYGRVPLAERWRVDAAGFLLIVFLLPFFVHAIRKQRLASAALLFASPLAAFLLLVGGWGGLPVIYTEQWGGFMLNIVLAYCAIIGSLPIGIAFALGRRSKLPLVRVTSIMTIEFFRGIPLITVLFTAQYILPIALPEGMNFNNLVRAIVAMTIFYAAYIAEVVRGGLQALPRGQYDAAHALGMGYFNTMLLVILPQALRLVLPGIVNTLIGLIKNTTLVTIIGLFDLLGIVKQLLGNPNWIGLATEGYLFVAAFFFVICFAMSQYSRNIERRIGASRR